CHRLLPRQPSLRCPPASSSQDPPFAAASLAAASRSSPQVVVASIVVSVLVNVPIAPTPPAVEVLIFTSVLSGRLFMLHTVSARSAASSSLPPPATRTVSSCLRLRMFSSLKVVHPCRHSRQLYA